MTSTQSLADMSVDSFENHYDLLHELGRGAFARVYQGIDNKTGETVAVKIITLTRFVPEMAAPSELKILESAANEVAIMRRLQRTLGKSKESKYIMQMRNALVEYDAELGTLSVFIVLELLAGGELFDRIVDKKKYSENDAAGLFRGMVAAVRGSHRAGVIHRDLKPENWCFSSTKETATLKLTDFGLSWAMDIPDLHTRMVVGSPGYIAPEVVRSACYTPACDVWSLGVMLYILLVGRPPFHGDSNKELFRHIKSGRFSFPSNINVSASARDLVSRMIVVDPTQRLTMSQVAKHTWLVSRHAQADLNYALQSMKEFNTMRKLKAAAMAVVWGAKSGSRRRLLEIMHASPRPEGFTRAELTHVRTELAKLRPKLVVSFGEFDSAMDRLGMANMPNQLIYDLIDTNKRNSVEISELVVALSTVTTGWDGGMSLIKFCFEVYEDSDGHVSANDLAKFLKIFFGDPRHGEVVGALYRFIGTLTPASGRGDVSYDEFTRAVAVNDNPVLTERLQGQLRSFGEQLQSFTDDALTRVRSSSLVKYMLGVPAGEEESESEMTLVGMGDSAAVAGGGGVLDAAGDGVVAKRPSLRRGSKSSKRSSTSRRHSQRSHKA